MTHLKGKVALITGGARGIGFTTAQKLAQLGAKIALFDMTDTVADSAREIDESARGYIVNVTKTDEVKAAVARVVEDFGSVDILVNNAGITADGFIIKMSDEQWDKVLDVNLKGSFIVLREVGSIMTRKQKSGTIVNIASVVGVMGNIGQANYSSSKAGLIGLTKTAAKEFARRGVRVNAVAPGFIQTAMTDKLKDKVKQAMEAQIPLQAFGQPEDVANAVAFLASNESSYITGQVLLVDGGMVM